jgi:hypothetical protein
MQEHGLSGAFKLSTDKAIANTKRLTCQRSLNIVNWFAPLGSAKASRRMSATGIRNPRVMIVPNLAKSEHRKLGLLRYLPVKDSRAVRSSVLVFDSASELLDFSKTWSVSRLSLRPILGISQVFMNRKVRNYTAWHAVSSAFCFDQRTACWSNLAHLNHGPYPQRISTTHF